MAARKKLTESECLALIQYVSDTFLSNETENAIAFILENLRESFNVSCVRIRERFIRPCSLRFTYESLSNSAKTRRVNEIITYEEDVWQGVMNKFSEGCYIYKADGKQSAPQFVGPVPNPPKCMIQVPMYSGSDFFGVLDLVDFENIWDWSKSEISALNVCANIICQYLIRLNLAFKESKRGNETDPLTGFMNFQTFTDRLDERFAEMLDNSPIAVIYTDIHHFRYVNETYGYRKGDELLKLVAQIMNEGAEEQGNVLLCHAHADNFITAAPVPEDTITDFDEFIYIMNEKISEYLQTSCPDIRIRMDTGICYIKDKSITAASAIANANLARKTAKKENMRRPLVFSDEMMEEIKYQEFLNNELPKAIKNHQLKVYYQPKINCSDDSLYGAEALVRWQRPDGTFIYPDKFIPVFEKNGNIVDVDFYVYREVFKYIRGRLDKKLPVFPISMNVSRIHFRTDRIIPYIEGLLKEYKIPTELVEFELTENIYMNNFSKADEFIKTCRDQGIHVSMDDFGSGYSSLNVISTLDIDTLKIDKIFLKNDELSENDKTVLESMIVMAKRLGMQVICEGVETESQTIFLKKANCDQIQGYYYGKPMDEASFNRFAEEMIIK